MSMWSQSALLSIVSEQAAPSVAKSALRIDGAMTAGGPIFVDFPLSMFVQDEGVWKR